MADADVDLLYEQAMVKDAMLIMGGSSSRSLGQIQILFNGWFGTSPFVVSHIWRRLADKRSLCRGAQMKHLLWALHFLKNYSQENQMAALFKSDKKTVRQWIWYMIREIASLGDEVVSWLIVVVNFILISF